MATFRFLTCLVIFALSSADGREIIERIVGGTEAKEGQFPYQVSISDLFIGHYCGGSILNENWILTAGRCVEGKHPLSLIVAAGITDLLDIPYAIYLVNKVVIHESKNLALINLKKSLVFSEFIKKIDLPTKNLNVADSPVTVSGWGALSWGGKVSKKLLYMDSKIYDLEKCKERIASLQKLPPVTDSNLCTFTHTGQGLCDGDSGNPVASGNNLAGVVLHGYPCARGYPDISINVWNYVDWIKSTIN